MGYIEDNIGTNDMEPHYINTLKQLLLDYILLNFPFILKNKWKQKNDMDHSLWYWTW